ncbi:hypothetical protein [Ornithinibacillus halotolerans]|nr:hypothetical protein [Ornithinibacillus halotolerans]
MVDYAWVWQIILKFGRLHVGLADYPEVWSITRGFGRLAVTFGRLP